MAVIKYYAPVRGTVGKDTEVIDAPTVAEVLSAIRKQYGKAAEKGYQPAIDSIQDMVRKNNVTADAAAKWLK